VLIVKDIEHVALAAVQSMWVGHCRSFLLNQGNCFKMCKLPSHMICLFHNYGFTSYWDVPYVYTSAH